MVEKSRRIPWAVVCKCWQVVDNVNSVINGLSIRCLRSKHIHNIELR